MHMFWVQGFGIFQYSHNPALLGVPPKTLTLQKIPFLEISGDLVALVWIDLVGQ